MITVLFVAIPLEHKGNRKLLACRSLAAFARYVGYPEMVNQGDSSKHALMAVAHGACAPLTCAAQRRSPVKSKASNGAAERDRAVQTAEGMPRTLRLDVPSRNNVAVGSILPIMSFLERDAAWLLSQAGSADGTTAHSRQLEKSHDSPLPPFAGTGHVKGSDTLGFQAEEQPGDTVRGWGDDRRATLTSLAREWAWLWLAPFDAFVDTSCRTTSERGNWQRDRRDEAR